MFVAGYQGSAEAVGDLLDVLIYAGEPSQKEAEKWHAHGHAIWSYANPQGGVENPEIYRRNYGLLLWTRDFDGACTYAYQDGLGLSGTISTMWSTAIKLTYPTRTA